MASVAAKATVRGALNQPLAFGCRSGAAVAAGAVASYLSVRDAELELPALSRQAPVSVVDCVSGPE
jgi:hypothetical protein